MTKKQTEQLVELLWNSLEEPRPYDPERRITGWGTKTQVGLVACIETIMRIEEHIALTLRDCLQLARDIDTAGRPHAQPCGCDACDFAIRARALVETYEQTENEIKEKERTEQ